MTSLVRLSTGLALLCALTLAPAAAAQSETLTKVMELFDRQEYVEAQNVALSVDREQLTDAQKEELDHLLKVLPDAVQGGKKAEQDRADADQAFEAGRWAEADRLYQTVMNNKYATAALRTHSDQQCQRIAEKKALEEVAEPPTPAAQPPTEPPAQEPAAQPSPKAAPPQQAGPQRLTVLDEMKQRDKLRWQRAVTKMEELARKAREAVAAEQFNEARQLAAQAMNRIEAARVYAEPAAQYETAKAQTVALKQEIDNSFDQYVIGETIDQRREIKERMKERARLHDRRTAEKVDQLFNTAHQLNQEERFEEAAEAIRQVLYLEPSNAEARHKLEVYEDFAAFSRQKATYRNRYRQQQAALIDANESLTPWSYEVLYPRNWLEISRRRAGYERGYGGVDEDRELNSRLHEILPDVLFEEQPVEMVFEFLADLNQVNMSIDWEDLEASGIERDKSVTLRLREVTYQTVLDEILSQLGGSDVLLGFSIANNVLRVATKEKLDRDKFVRVYDIRDLLVTTPNFTNAQRLDPAQALQQAAQVQAGIGGGGGIGLFNQAGSNTTDVFDQGLNENMVVDDIVDVIRQNVEPDSWRETGGGDGALRELNGQLIVYNTSDAHEQVSDLLSQLRETQALQIAIEARILSVTDNFMEELGVDLDFVFNSGTADFDQAFQAGAPITDPFTGSNVLVPRPFSRIGGYASPVSPPFGVPMVTDPSPSQPWGQAAFVPPNSGLVPTMSNMTPVTMQQGSLGLVAPGSITTGVPGSLTNLVQPALNIAGSFLDNLQVDFLIRATQANRRSSILQAPRLVLFNTQTANIFVGNSRYFVGSLVPQLAEGAVAFAPVPVPLQSGTSLLVQATISADRRYVSVNADVRQIGAPRITRFETQRASGNSPGAFIQLPEYDTAQIQTTVSIPDGGTVLLGGMKLAGEVEIEAGIPILSKIPILKRAFTNTTTVKDVQTLLILMKAKIIIQKEAEEEAFPTLSGIAG